MRGHNSKNWYDIDMITHINLLAMSLYYSCPQQRHTKLYHTLCLENSWERESNVKRHLRNFMAIVLLPIMICNKAKWKISIWILFIIIWNYIHTLTYNVHNFIFRPSNVVTAWFSPGNIESDVDYGTLYQIIVTGPEAIYTKWKNCIDIASNLQAAHALDYGVSSRGDILDNEKRSTIKWVQTYNTHIWNIMDMKMKYVNISIIFTVLVH